MTLKEFEEAITDTYRFEPEKKREKIMKKLGNTPIIVLWASCCQLKEIELNLVTYGRKQYLVIECHDDFSIPISEFEKSQKIREKLLKKRDLKK